MTKAEQQHTVDNRHKRSLNVAYIQSRLQSHHRPTYVAASARYITILLVFVLILVMGLPPLRRALFAAVRGRVVVTIYLPPAATTDTPILNETLPIAQFGTTATRGNIRADPISATVDYTVREQVASNQSGPVVQESDVQMLLSPALSGLNNRAREVLTAHAEQRGLVLEVTTVIPHPETLSAGQGYVLTVSPSVEQPVDNDTLTFSVNVEGSFSALATPPGQPLDEQLATALLHHLEHHNRLPPGMQVSVTNWRWDGTILSVDGVLSSTDGVQTLNAQTQAAIRDAIRGKSFAEAVTALEQMKQQGIIGGYTLPPDREHLPDVDFLLELHIVPAGAPE